MHRAALLPFVLLVAGVAAQDRSDYVVLAAFAPTDPFDAAAQKLAEHRHAPIVRFDPADLSGVRQALAQAAPRNVALVMRPEQIDFAFQRRFLQLATEVDDDPFVDFAFGYITGRTADDAVALVTRDIERQPSAEPPRLATVAGGVEKSVVVSRPHVLRRQRLDGFEIYCAGDKAFPKDGRDLAFLAEQLPKLAGRDVVTFAGHGWPREVVGGPTFAELDGLRLDDAVVLNVACYTGVTHAWFEDDYRAGRTVRHELPLDESFCLALLRTGVVGYTAYLCPRPAGPELDTDLAAMVADGLSLGDARRRDYDKTVLGFLGFGEERMELDDLRDGDALPPHPDPVRDMMLEGATGGVLFGDPAVVPFAKRDDESPVAIDVKDEDGALRVHASAALVPLYLDCADPTARFGKSMAMKVYARLPIGDRLVEDVVVDDLRVGSTRLPSRVLWAVEDDHGERFLQLKVNFPREERMLAGMSMSARVVTTDDAARAKTRGGEVQPPRIMSKDVKSRAIQAFMLERAKARDVSRKALQAALDASAAELGDKTVELGSLERLASFGSEGFRAVCVLLEVGHAHYHTWKLLEATWHPGDERHLISLATYGDLPNYASWQVLEGLGVADTPEVRRYLLDRLANEPDAGLYMAAARGVAHLGARDAAAAIGDRVLEQRDGWSGVERYLIEALGELGGPDAIDRLERIAKELGPDSRKSALYALGKLDPDRAARLSGEHR